MKITREREEGKIPSPEPETEPPTYISLNRLQIQISLHRMLRLIFRLLQYGEGEIYCRRTIAIYVSNRFICDMGC